MQCRIFDITGENLTINDKVAKNEHNALYITFLYISVKKPVFISVSTFLKSVNPRLVVCTV